MTAPLLRVGDKIPRGAAVVPSNVAQFVDQRYLRVWSKHPANPAGMWGSAIPSVAYDERHLLDDCGPLVVTAVHGGQLGRVEAVAQLVALADQLDADCAGHGVASAVSPGLRNAADVLTGESWLLKRAEGTDSG